jgi:hypothetical protein
MRKTEKRCVQIDRSIDGALSSMGIFTLAGVFFLVIALILLGYSSRSEEEMNNIPSRFKGIYAFLILLGISLIVMDNLDRIFPYHP